MREHPGDSELGERVRDAWHAEEQPLTPQERVAFNTTLYERIEARRRHRRWRVALAVPVLAAGAMLVVAIVQPTDVASTEAFDPWTSLAEAHATWEETFTDDVTDATIKWLARPNPEAELSELLSSDYQLMAAWLDTTTTRRSR